MKVTKKNGLILSYGQIILSLRKVILLSASDTVNQNTLSLVFILISINN